MRQKESDAMGGMNFPFPDQRASFLILQEDPCYGKIEPLQVKEVFEKAWKRGEWEAERFLAAYAGNALPSMEDILYTVGFSVEIHDCDYVMGNVRYFCEYLSEKNIVRVYRRSVELWAQTNDFTYEDAQNLILAHEYFHYLEWHEIGLLSRQCEVPMISLGKLKLGKTGVAALSEVGANAFANKCYMNLWNKKKEQGKNHKEV